MKLNIMHPLYVVAGLSSQSEPGNQWMPISTQTYPVQHVAEREAEKRDTGPDDADPRRSLECDSDEPVVDEQPGSVRETPRRLCGEHPQEPVDAGAASVSAETEREPDRPDAAGERADRRPREE